MKCKLSSELGNNNEIKQLSTKYKTNINKQKTGMSEKT